MSRKNNYQYKSYLIFVLNQQILNISLRLKLLPMILISIDFLPIHEFRHVFCMALLGPVLANCSFLAQVSFWWTQSDKSRIAAILVSSIILNDLTQNLYYQDEFCHIQFIVPNNEGGGSFT